jgi:hypothetical protein
MIQKLTYSGKPKTHDKNIIAKEIQDSKWFRRNNYLDFEQQAQWPLLGDHGGQEPWRLEPWE